jgi:superfamily II DNA or RNA helicase
MSYRSVQLLRKFAEASLRPHQERVVEKVSLQPTLAVHSLGSGKTLTALQSILKAKRDNPGKKALVVAPASLGQNIWKEVEKHGIPLKPSDVTVISYEALARNPEKYNSSAYSIVVIDEVHRIRNTGTKMKTSLDTTLLSTPDARVLGLTATPVFNKPEDLGVIVNTISRKKILPEDSKSFANQFMSIEKYEPGFFARLGGATPGVTTKLKNLSVLENSLRGRVDYFDAKSDPEYLKMFPSSSEREVTVTMTPEQQAVYQYLEGRIPRALRTKINKGLPLSKQEASQLNSFLTGVRQAANTPVEYMTDPSIREKNYLSPKIQRIADDFDSSAKGSPGFKGVVYSNYLKSGLAPARDALVNKGYRAEVFSGELSAKEKKKIIDAYNAGDLDAMLVSSAGSEGLDLKGTRMVQVMEPHFNAAKIDQVIGRAIRYGSHTHLPEDQRKVEVLRYYSAKNPTFFQEVFGLPPDQSVDRFLKNLSDEKTMVDRELRKVMQRATMEKTAARSLLSWQKKNPAK